GRGDRGDRLGEYGWRCHLDVRGACGLFGVLLVVATDREDVAARWVERRYQGQIGQLAHSPRGRRRRQDAQTLKSFLTGVDDTENRRWGRIRLGPVGRGADVDDLVGCAIVSHTQACRLTIAKHQQFHSLFASEPDVELRLVAAPKNSSSKSWRSRSSPG